MNNIQIQNMGMLHLLWIIPIIIVLYVYTRQKRRKALKIFINSGLLNRITISVNSARRTWKAIAFIIAMIFIIMALTRPGWNPKSKTIKRRGRDVVFLLDVSKSMLAEDLAPNRLERAKLAIRDCLDYIQGDRVALVVFAGSTAIKCPLTLDYGFFKMMLDNISTESIARGGTMIGDALRKTIDEVFDDLEKQYKDIILITDGEDHDSFPIEAAKRAGEQKIRIIAIGLGDENEGKRIPITDEYGRKTFMKYNNQEIWTKLDADTLRKMVNNSEGGKYFNVSTGTIDLGKVYMDIIASAEKKALQSRTIKKYEEKFQIFLSIALILLCIETAVSDRKQNKGTK